MRLALALSLLLSFQSAWGGHSDAAKDLISKYLASEETGSLAFFSDEVTLNKVVAAVFSLPPDEFEAVVRELETAGPGERTFALAGALQTAWENRFGELYFAHVTRDLTEAQKTGASLGAALMLLSATLAPAQVPARFALFRNAFSFVGPTAPGVVGQSATLGREALFRLKSYNKNIPNPPAEILSFGFVDSGEQQALELLKNEVFIQNMVLQSGGYVALAEQLAGWLRTGKAISFSAGRLVKQALILTLAFFVAEKAAEKGALEWNYRSYAGEFQKIRKEMLSQHAPKSETLPLRLATGAKILARFQLQPLAESLDRALRENNFSRGLVDGLKWQKEVLGYEIMPYGLGLLGSEASFSRRPIDDARMEAAEKRMILELKATDARLRADFISALDQMGDRNIPLHYLESDPRLVEVDVESTRGLACQFYYERHLTLEALTAADPVYLKSVLEGHLNAYSKRLPEIFKNKFDLELRADFGGGAHLTYEEKQKLWFRFLDQNLQKSNQELISRFKSGSDDQGLGSCRNPFLINLETELFLKSLNNPVATEAALGLRSQLSPF